MRRSPIARGSRARALAVVLRQVAVCTACPTIPAYHKFPPTAHGRRNARFMLIGEAPGHASVENRRQWTGRGGMLLRREIRRLGLDLEDLFYLTNVVKCWPARPGRRPGNRSPLRSEVRRCGSFLAAEIAAVDPTVIVAVGAISAREITGQPVRLPDDHGRRLRIGSCEVVVLLHPANANRHRRVWRTYRVSLLGLFAELAVRAGFAIVEVTAAVIARDGRYLVAQRTAGQHLGGMWEFPGGKRRLRESLESCLERELREELGVDAVVGERMAVVPWSYPTRRVVLHFFRCEIGRKPPKPREGQSIRWVTPRELGSLPLPPADAEVVRRLGRSRNGAGARP